MLTDCARVAPENKSSASRAKAAQVASIDTLQSFMKDVRAQSAARTN
jgi:hypothetical protein